VEKLQVKLKTAIVIPWFGAELHGGAEQHAWQIAHQLQARNVSVTVLTTCCKSFHDDWATNHYNPGEYTENNIKIIRFPVNPRDRGIFDRTVAKLLSLPHEYFVPGGEHIPWKLEEIYIRENINSAAMLNYIKDNVDNFDAFIFIPYLFSPVIEGVKLAKNKAILLPCLHDEPYAYLESVKRSFYECGRIMFNSHGEQLLACRLYGEWILNKSSVTGAGVEIDRNKLSTSSTLDTADYGDYLLYLGRKCAEKNVPLLIEAFEEFIHQTGSSLRLLLAGPSDMPIKPTTNQVQDLGVVSEETKYKLLQHCRVLVNPSENESFSRVIFEAWFAGKPVVVNRKCLATYTALADSGFAGWCADTKESFIQVFKEIASASRQTLQEIGKKGTEFATSMADWDMVMSRIIAELNLLNSQNSHIRILNESRQIVILAHTIGESSPLARDAMGQVDILSTRGYKVKVYCNQITTGLPLHPVKRDYLITPTQSHTLISIIQWSSQWDELPELVSKLQGQKILRLMETKNMEELKAILSSIQPSLVLCSSDLQLSRVQAVWNGEATVLPPCYAPETFPHHSILLPLFKKFDDSYVNVLIIGEFSANYSECFSNAITLYQNKYGENIRCFLLSREEKNAEDFIGTLPAQTIVQIIHQHNSTPDELYTYYKVADIAICLQDESPDVHENILLLQYWGIPVIKLQTDFDKKTSKNSVITIKPDPYLLAGAIRILSMDSEERTRVIHSGYKNVSEYSEGALSHHFISALSTVIDIQAYPPVRYYK
jgi:glycosyltransferase involved in cell wall biosynthesis